VRALKRLLQVEGLDAIIIGRGGGSKEDLECFNSEELAKAVIESPIPIVSAVGHETDMSILDLAASYSVSTPTAAAELIFPDSTAITGEVLNAVQSMKISTENSINSRLMLLDNLVLSLKSPLEIVTQTFFKTERLLYEAVSKVKELIFDKINTLSELEKTLETNNPLSPMERGFVVLTQDGKMVKRKSKFKKSSPFSIKFKDGNVDIKD